MAWDACLDKDLKDIVNQLVVATNHLPTGNPMKYSMSTPNQGLQVFYRALELLPPTWIVQDCERTVLAMKEVYKNDGRMIVGVVCSGVRHEVHAATQGGCREKIMRDPAAVMAMLPDEIKTVKREQICAVLQRAVKSTQAITEI